MPYSMQDIPERIKNLPKHAQEIWVAAFNSAWEQYKGDEEKCNMVAWAAVKQRYRQDEKGEWHAMQASQSQFSGRILTSATNKFDASYGWKWDVQIIEAGEDKMGKVIYPLSVLHAAVPLYEGARVFALSNSQHDIKSEFGHSVRDMVGRVQHVSKIPTGLRGEANLLRTANNQWLRDALVELYEQGMIGEGSTNDILGLSHDVYGSTVKQGSKLVATKILKVNSVDVVYEPIAGGKFLRMAAAYYRSAGRKKEVSMFKELLAALKMQRPDLKEKIEALEAKGETVTIDEINILVAAAVAKPEGAGMQEFLNSLTQMTASMRDQTLSDAKKIVDDAMKSIQEAQLVASCSTKLAQALIDCGLISEQQSRIRKQFDGKIFKDEELTAAIKEEKEIADKLTGSGIPVGAGGLRATVVEGEPERLQAALDKLLEVDVTEKHKDVPAFTSLRGAYVRITGDPDFRGVPSRDGLKLGEAFMNMMRLPAAYSTASFTYVLGNSMYRRLLKEYRRVDYREDALISFIRNAENFKTLEIIQIGYFGDVPDVNPETGDYQEITMPTDIEATYSVNQKGWILSITRRVLMNDDLKSVSQLVSKMGRAHRRTHAKRAWNKIIDNATFKGDTTALFHSNHSNLGATGLTADATGIATLTARLKAMYAQTEQDSGEGLALIPLYLWCPRDTREVAEQLNSAWPGASTPNPHAGKFGANHERIITNPLFTDANDWGLIADKNDVELLEAAYLNNQREPEFFVADNPLVGQMFIADKIQYKSRHEFEFEIADYRGFDKAVVA